MDVAAPDVGMPPLGPTLARHLACRHTGHTDRELTTCIAATLGISRELLKASMVALILADAEHEALAATPQPVTTGRDVATRTLPAPTLRSVPDAPARTCGHCGRVLPRATDRRTRYCDLECGRRARNVRLQKQRRAARTTTRRGNR